MLFAGGSYSVNQQRYSPIGMFLYIILASYYCYGFLWFYFFCSVLRKSRKRWVRITVALFILFLMKENVMAWVQETDIWNPIPPPFSIIPATLCARHHSPRDRMERKRRRKLTLYTQYIEYHSTLSLPSLPFTKANQWSSIVKRVIHRFNKIAMPPRRTGRRSNSAYKKGDYVEVS